MLVKVIGPGVVIPDIEKMGRGDMDTSMPVDDAPG